LDTAVAFRRLNKRTHSPVAPLTKIIRSGVFNDNVVRIEATPELTAMRKMLLLEARGNRPPEISSRKMSQTMRLGASIDFPDFGDMESRIRSSTVNIVVSSLSNPTPSAPMRINATLPKPPQPNDACSVRELTRDTIVTIKESGPLQHAKGLWRKIW